MEPDFSAVSRELSQECLQTYCAVRAYLMDKPLASSDEPPKEYQALLQRAREALGRYLSHCSA